MNPTPKNPSDPTNPEPKGPSPAGPTAGANPPGATPAGAGTPGAEDRGALLAELERIAASLHGLDLHDPAACQRALAERVPAGSLARVRALCEAGLGGGWLVPKENGGIRFGRVAKDLHGFTVDAVLMDRAGPAHRHPNGEIDLLFARRGEPRFDGHAEGWAVYPPGSTHVPAVTGGEMVILYFLPGGAIEWT